MTSRKAGWLAAAAFWTFFGLLTGLQVWISMITHGHSVPRLLGYYLLGWGPWLGFTVVIVGLNRRWPVVPLGRRNALLHLCVALLLGIAHGAYWIELTVSLRPFDRMTAEFSKADVAGFLISQLPVELILYGGVIAALYTGDYIRRERERQVHIAQLETSLSNARLHALELQIQPHFLFNTLNVISSLVRTGEQAEAVGMIAGLSDLLRYTLDHAGEQSVTLDEEGAMLRRYLEIQRSRFPDRLTFGVDVEPEVRRAAVPTLILQPLAENAIRHGIARSAGAGTVNVRAFRCDGKLRIEMFNSGTLRPGPGEGIGLRNTRERLRQLYGEAHHFEIREHGGGVLASLSIPCVELT
ncbi:MAG TPA: histidine kinase [Thermoanaerobaculia bacterium]|jgi:LytS/YehU family sensor histidine kinase|nr:histidine kinase [Thermoanaerobaculia bacterium]